MKSKNRLKYDLLIYSGSFNNPEFVHLVLGLSSLHECFTRCSLALSIVIRLKEEGFIKIFRDCTHIGNYYFDRHNNVFVFKSIENPFNNLPKHERKK